MNWRVWGKVAFAISVTMLVQLNTAGFQGGSPPQEIPSKSYKLISTETHDRVLEILFSRYNLKGDYWFVLRFKPSSSPESQIVVREERDKIEVVEYTSLSGNIYSKLNSIMAEGGKEDAIEMAKLIKVGKRSIDIPDAQARQWRTSFFKSIGDSIKAFKQRSEEYDKGIGTLTIDGTFYNLWYHHVDHITIAFDFYDEEVRDRQPNGDLKLVQWMNAVRRDIERLK
jgi:hypothetical protein